MTESKKSKREKTEVKDEIEGTIANKVIKEQETRVEEQLRKLRLLVVVGLALSNCFVFAWVLSALRMDIKRLTPHSFSSFIVIAICCILFVVGFTFICCSQIKKMNIDIKKLIGQATDDAYSDIIARNEELMRVNKTLLEEKKISDERVVMKQKYLSQISHEMRNPLTAIIFTINKAEKCEDAEQLKKHIEKISESSKHMLNVLNDTLETAKLEAGEVSLVHTVFAIKDIFNNLINMFSCSAENKNIALTLELSPTIPEYIFGDKLKVTQVLINLISNAMKFTEPGGSITVAAESAGGSNENVTVKFTVKDTGIGIAPDKLEMIFEDFKQASNRQSGTGLGLPISRKIALLMHGDLRVKSTLGQGSEFTFTALFAVADQSQIQNETRKSVKDFDLTGKTVLIVEDVEINAEMIGLYFENAKANVIYASNGGEALEVWNKSHTSVDLIMMDIYMPVMNGIKAAKMIRSSHKRGAPTVPIIALSGNSFDESESENYSEAGMNDYLMKPATESAIVNLITKYLIKPSAAQ